MGVKKTLETDFIDYYDRGWVEEVWYNQKCASSVVTIPGTSLWNQKGLVCMYLVGMVWLFAGIAIVSDIFMEAIEAITANTWS